MTRGGQQRPRGGRGNAQNATTITNTILLATQQQGPLPNLQGPPSVPVMQPEPLNLEGNPRNRPWAEVSSYFDPSSDKSANNISKRWHIRQMRRREIDALDVDAAWFSAEFTNLRTQQPLPVNLPRTAREMRTPVPDLPDPAVAAPPTVSLIFSKGCKNKCMLILSIAHRSLYHAC